MKQKVLFLNPKHKRSKIPHIFQFKSIFILLLLVIATIAFILTFTKFKTTKTFIYEKTTYKKYNHPSTSINNSSVPSTQAPINYFSLYDFYTFLSVINDSISIFSQNSSLDSLLNTITPHNQALKQAAKEYKASRIMQFEDYSQIYQKKIFDCIYPYLFIDTNSFIIIYRYITDHTVHSTTELYDNEALVLIDVFLFYTTNTFISTLVNISNKKTLNKEAKLIESKINNNKHLKTAVNTLFTILRESSKGLFNTYKTNVPIGTTEGIFVKRNLIRNFDKFNLFIVFCSFNYYIMLFEIDKNYEVTNVYNHVKDYFYTFYKVYLNKKYHVSKCIDIFDNKLKRIVSKCKNVFKILKESNKENINKGWIDNNRRCLEEIQKLHGIIMDCE